MIPSLPLNEIASVSICDGKYIRQIRQVRSSLELNSAVLLANSLVSNRLDFCNSLYYGLPSCSIKRLQLVQNSLARAVVPSVRKYDHISVCYNSFIGYRLSNASPLNWLPLLSKL